MKNEIYIKSNSFPFQIFLNQYLAQLLASQTLVIVFGKCCYDAMTLPSPQPPLCYDIRGIIPFLISFGVDTAGHHIL